MVQKYVFKIILSGKHLIFLKRSIWLIDGTPSSTTTPGQIEPGSNGNEEMTQHFTELHI